MLKQIIDLFFSAGLIINAALFLPQALRLYRVKHAKDVSLITFLGFFFINVFIGLHALTTHDYLLFFGTSLSIVTSGLVAALILYYRFKEID